MNGITLKTLAIQQPWVPHILVKVWAIVQIYKKQLGSVGL
jgi:hypothetical protein